MSRKTTAIVGVLVLVAAVVVFIVLQSGSDSSSGGADRSLSFRVDKSGQAVGGVQKPEVAQGDHLTVTLHTDIPAELHIHGYELAKDLEAGQTGSINFTADATGEFEIEAHHLIHGDEGAGISLATLQVNP